MKMSAKKVLGLVLAGFGYVNPLSPTGRTGPGKIRFPGPVLNFLCITVFYSRSHIALWQVLEITSICCSFVRSINFTA